MKDTTIALITGICIGFIIGSCWGIAITLLDRVDSSHKEQIADTQPNRSQTRTYEYERCVSRFPGLAYLC